MSSIWLNNIGRAVVFIILQILLFKQMSITVGGLGFMHFFIYPLIIVLLPLNTPKPLLILGAFILGLLIDVFYDSPGVNAAAMTLMGYSRAYILSYIEPFEGYGINDTPTVKKFGLNWFMIYSGVMLFIFLITFFMGSYFSYVFIGKIIMNTIFSFAASYIIWILYVLILNPE